MFRFTKNLPKIVLLSCNCSSVLEFQMNFFAIIFGSNFIKFSWCTWHIMTLFSRFCVKVLRSQVFNLLRALNVRSASHELAGDNKSKRRRISTCGNILLTSVTILEKSFLQSSMEEYWLAN